MPKGIKIALAVIGITLVALGVLSLLEYYRYRESEEYFATGYLEELANQYKNDTYGGATPEETLQLFIDALEAGDTDLAAKYFSLELQDKWRVDLKKIKDGGALNSLLSDLSTAKRRDNISENSAAFSIVNKNNEVVSIINITRTSSNRWKISDF